MRPVGDRGESSAMLFDALCEPFLLAHVTNPEPARSTYIDRLI